MKPVCDWCEKPTVVQVNDMNACLDHVDDAFEVIATKLEPFREGL